MNVMDLALVLAGLGAALSCLVWMLMRAHSFGMRTGRMQGWNEAFDKNWTKLKHGESWSFDGHPLRENTDWFA